VLQSSSNSDLFAGAMACCRAGYTMGRVVPSFRRSLVRPAPTRRLSSSLVWLARPVRRSQMTTGLLDRFHGGGASVRRARGDYDPGAFACVQLSDCPAEAATGARHDGRPARQAAWSAQCVALGGCTHGIPISA